jgi:hypothetical protein
VDDFLPGMFLEIRIEHENLAHFYDGPGGLSMIIVTGPSLTRATSIIA